MQAEQKQTWWSRTCGGREVLTLALPLVLSTASWTLMHFVDRVFLTWYSTAAIAAAMPAGMLHFAVLCLPLGIASYANSFVAQYYGADHRERVGLAAWQAVWIGVAAAPLFVMTIPLADGLFQLAAHGDRVLPLEIEYYRVLTYGASGTVVSAAMAAFFTGLGRSRVVMAVDFAAALVNIGLDYLLIFGVAGFPEWGIFGAGLATVIAQWSKVFVFGAIMLSRTYREPFGVVKGCRVDWTLAGRLIRYGGPSGMQMALEATAFSLYVVLMGQLGEQALAATTVAFSVNSITFVPLLGLGIAVSTLVGQQLGANQPELASRATWTSFVLGSIYAGTMALLVISMPGLFLAAHGAGGDGESFHEIQAICRVLLRFVAAYCFMDMMHVVFVSAIKGAGDTRFVMWVTATIVPVPLLLGWLGLHHWDWQLNHFWAVVTGWICVLGVVYLWRFLQGKWRDMRVIEPQFLMPDDHSAERGTLTDDGVTSDECATIEPAG